jgi:hypothetical protein
MSSCAFAILIGYVAVFGVTQAGGGDEGLAARAFQLLLAGQLPLIGIFAFKWVRRYPGEGLLILAAQAGAIIAAVAMVTVLEAS